MYIGKDNTIRLWNVQTHQLELINNLTPLTLNPFPLSPYSLTLSTPTFLTLNPTPLIGNDNYPILECPDSSIRISEYIYIYTYI
jgi:hypothetical protein